MAVFDDLFDRPGQVCIHGVYSETFTAAAFQTWFGSTIDTWEYHTRKYGTTFSGPINDITADTNASLTQPQPTFWTVGYVWDGGPSLASVAAGSFDSDITALANRIIARHNKPAPEPIMVRFNQEFNANWFGWRVMNTTDAANYAASFRRVVDRFRAVAGGSRFLFCYSPNVDPGSSPLSTAVALSYPGDAYVDLIGPDVYYMGWYNNNPTARFNEMKNYPDSGLDATYNMAVARGKKWCIPEYGFSGDAAGGPPHPETIDARPFVSLFAKYCRDHNCVWLGYWNSNSAYPGALNIGQYPLIEPEYKKQFGPAVFSSTNSASVAAGVAFSKTITCTIADHITYSLVANPGGLSIVALDNGRGTLSKAGSGGGTYACTIRATTVMGYTTDQVHTLTVTGTVTPATVGSLAQTEQADTLLATQSAFVDLWPAYAGYFDPVHGSYKVAGVVTNSMATFLAMSSVHFTADPTAGFSAAGYLPTAGYDLYIELPPIATWSVYVEAATVTHASGAYESVVQLMRAAEPTTVILIAKDGFATAPQMSRSAVRDNNTVVGIDTSYAAIPASGDFRVAMTTTASAIKFFGASALGYTNMTAMLATKPVGRILIGDGFTTSWPGRIKLIRWKYTADSDAAVITAMGTVTSLNVTEANDVLTAAGDIVSGVAVLAVTEAPDAVAGAGALLIAGSLARVEAGDVVAAVSGLAITASMVGLEAADIFGCFATLPIVGTLTRVEGTDTLAAGSTGNVVKLGANTILLSSNLQDTGLISPPVDLTDIADDPMTPDADWWTAVDPMTPVMMRLGLPTPPEPLIGTQRFRVMVRKTGWHDPRVTVALCENGVLIRNLLTSVPVTSPTGQMLEAVWNASELSDQSGAGPEILVFVEV